MTTNDKKTDYSTLEGIVVLFYAKHDAFIHRDYQAVCGLVSSPTHLRALADLLEALESLTAPLPEGVTTKGPRTSVISWKDGKRSWVRPVPEQQETIDEK